MLAVALKSMFHSLASDEFECVTSLDKSSTSPASTRCQLNWDSDLKLDAWMVLTVALSGRQRAADRTGCGGPVDMGGYPRGCFGG